MCSEIPVVMVGSTWATSFAWMTETARPNDHGISGEKIGRSLSGRPKPAGVKSWDDAVAFAEKLGLRLTVFDPSESPLTAF